MPSCAREFGSALALGPGLRLTASLQAEWQVHNEVRGKASDRVLLYFHGGESLHSLSLPSAELTFHLLRRFHPHEPKESSPSHPADEQTTRRPSPLGRLPPLPRGAVPFSAPRCRRRLPVSHRGPQNPRH